MPPLPLTDVFADLPGPRRDTRNKLHRPTDVLVITTCAVIAGAGTREAIAEHGRTEEASFRRFLPPHHGIPGPDTFERALAKLDTGAFARPFGRWMTSACEATGLVPVAGDGKSARAAKRGTAAGCLHVVTPWAAGNRLVLGTASVADGSNEVAAIAELLRVLGLAGATVTIDAAGCQVGNARLIRQREGHHLPALKDNQPTPRAAVGAVIGRACEADFQGARCDGHESDEDGHGRPEERYATAVYGPDGLPAERPDVAAVAQVDREREVGGERAVTGRDDIASRAGTAADFARWVRGRRGIEGGLHRVPDVVFGEGRSRIRAEDAGADLAMIRRVAVSLLRRAPGEGGGVTERPKAGWDDDHLRQAMQGIPASISAVALLARVAKAEHRAERCPRRGGADQIPDADLVGSASPSGVVADRGVVLGA